MLCTRVLHHSRDELGQQWDRRRGVVGIRVFNLNSRFGFRLGNDIGSDVKMDLVVSSPIRHDDVRIDYIRFPWEGLHDFGADVH